MRLGGASGNDADVFAAVSVDDDQDLSFGPHTESDKAKLGGIAFVGDCESEVVIEYALGVR